MVNKERRSSASQHLTDPDDLAEPPPSQTLSFRFTDFGCTKGNITDAADPTSTILYHIWSNTWKRQVVFIDSADRELARVTYSTWCNKLTVNFRGQATEMKTPNKWTNKSYDYTSIVLANSHLRWERHSGTGWKKQIFSCVNAQSVPIARMILRNHWWKAGIVWVEFLGEQSTPQDIREELMVTGLSLCFVYQMSPHGPYG